MSEHLRGVVVSHGQVAQALVDAVRQITGTADHLVAVTNVDCGREGLLERLTHAVGDGPAVVFVDLPSGSCLQASLTYLRSHARVAGVAGVNLAMLLDFVLHDDAAPEQAAERALATGGRSIRRLQRS